MTVRSILWTGGFDSTWLVVDALLRGERVDAFTSTGWNAPHKAVREMVARERIKQTLPAQLRRHLWHVEECHADVAIERRAKQTWAEMLTVEPAGTSPQNQILALLPAVIGRPVLDTGHVKDDPTTNQVAVRAILERHGIRMPLAHVTKVELLADARRRGFDNVLDLTWSCEGPLDRDDGPGLTGPPCGECEPCRMRIMAAQDLRA